MVGRNIIFGFGLLAAVQSFAEHTVSGKRPLFENFRNTETSINPCSLIRPQSIQPAMVLPAEVKPELVHSTPAPAHTSRIADVECISPATGLKINYWKKTDSSPSKVALFERDQLVSELSCATESQECISKMQEYWSKFMNKMLSFALSGKHVGRLGAPDPQCKGDMPFTQGQLE